MGITQYPSESAPNSSHGASYAVFGVDGAEVQNPKSGSNLLGVCANNSVKEHPAIEDDHVAHDFVEECLLESDGVAAAYLLIMNATPEQRTPTGFFELSVVLFLLLLLLPLPLILGREVLGALVGFHAMRSSAEGARFLDPRVQGWMGPPPGEEKVNSGRKVQLPSEIQGYEVSFILGIPRFPNVGLDALTDAGHDRSPDTA